MNVGTGSIRLEGAFSENPVAAGPRRVGLIADAVTEVKVGFGAGWKAEDAKMAIDVTITRATITTIYFGTTKPTDPHDRDTTIGNHERRHREFAQSWWTEERLTRTVAEMKMALTLSCKAHLTKDQGDAQARAQADAITNYLVDLHNYEQEVAFDKGMTASGQPSQAPRFGGVRK